MEARTSTEGRIDAGRGKHICVGLLAHVDAGKTTLSEAMLYLAGSIRKPGRVDHGTAFLDTDEMERRRGITVFSKEARLTLDDVQLTLLDTPGHADLSGEMERTMRVLDCAILIISGADGVQSHTATLWRLLERNEIPTFVFVNKMDQPGTDAGTLLRELRQRLGDGFIAFGPDGPQPDQMEDLAMCSEALMEAYLRGEADETDETDEAHAADTAGVNRADPVSPTEAAGLAGPAEAAAPAGAAHTAHLSMEVRAATRAAIASRQVFPVYFGAALQCEGVEPLLAGLAAFAPRPAYPAAFGARVYKITRDAKGMRQTHLKVTGGTLKPRMLLTGSTRDGLPWEEKVDQIRLYDGEGFQTTAEAEAGMICTLTGLSATWAGEGLGYEAARPLIGPMLEPALTYEVLLPPGVDAITALQKLKQIEEEEPLLHVTWKESLQEIHVQVMGELELEILQNILLRRFDLDVRFGQGSLLYRETIDRPVVGVGHFEPLRHYAEVHLLLEPASPGSGLSFESRVSEDKLSRNWQNLILTHLAETTHPGALIGAPVTDMKITLLSGRAHIKHTEGGDFRQATYRAVRQGLRKARAEGAAVLLEPLYAFRLEVPAQNMGRAMTDLLRLGAVARLEESTQAGTGASGSVSMDTPAATGAPRQGEWTRRDAAAAAEEGMAVITGHGPVATLRQYAREVAAYTHGRGRFFTSQGGYGPCHDQAEVVEASGYVPEADLTRPCGSVFCDRGGALYVEWMDVDAMAHIEVETVEAAQAAAGGPGTGVPGMNAAGPFPDGDGRTGTVLSGNAAGRTGKALSGEAMGGGGVSGSDTAPAGVAATQAPPAGRAAAPTAQTSSVDVLAARQASAAPTAQASTASAAQALPTAAQAAARAAAEAELEAIFLRTYGKSKRDESLRRAQKSLESRSRTVPDPRDPALHRRQETGAPPYLIVDGYNVLFAWDSLKELAAVSLDAARESLLEALANYQGYRDVGILVVFDGYKVAGSPGSQQKIGKMDVVYTREAETADRFIEKTIYELGRTYRITVVTSDRPVQMAAWGDGAERMSAREFYQELVSTSQEIRALLQRRTLPENRPFAGKL